MNKKTWDKMTKNEPKLTNNLRILNIKLNLIKNKLLLFEHLNLGFWGFGVNIAVIIYNITAIQKKWGTRKQRRHS